MKLLMSQTSPYARKVRILMIEKGMAFEEVDVHASGPSANLAHHNPLGKIPALVLDDGTDLFDSVVLVEYLDAAGPGPRLIPEEPLARAVVRRWEALADGVADATVAAMLESRRAADKQDPAVAERQLGKVRAALGRAERDLGERAHCHGESFTLADAAVLSALGYVRLRFPSVLEGHFPGLSAFAARHAARPSVVKTAPPG